MSAIFSEIATITFGVLALLRRDYFQNFNCSG